MDALLPSEIARLVLGYLLQECDEAAKCLLKSSPLLSEYYKQSLLGRKYPTTVNGYSLTDILNEYCSVHEIVQESYGKMVSASLDQPKSLLERLRHLVKSCQPVQVNISLCTRPEQTVNLVKPDSSHATQDADIRKETFPLSTLALSDPQEISYSTSSQNFQGLASCPPPPRLLQPKDSSIHQASLVPQSTAVPEQRLPLFVHSELQTNSKLDKPTSSTSVFMQQIPQSQDLSNVNVHSTNDFLPQSSSEEFLNTSGEKSQIGVSSNIATTSEPGTMSFNKNNSSYTVTESFGSSIVILGSTSQPLSSCSLPQELKDGDISKKVVSSQEKSKSLTPCKNVRELTEKMSVALEKNTAFTERIAANITKVIQATPVKQSDSVFANPAVQNQGQPEDGVNDIVHTILRQTEEDPIFESFLHEFLNFPETAAQNCNEASSESQSTSGKKKKKNTSRKSTETVADIVLTTNVTTETSFKASSEAVDAGNSGSNKGLTFGLTPAKLTTEVDTLTPLSKLLKSITSPTDELYLEPSQFAGLVDVNATDEKASKPEAAQQQIVNTATMSVPVIVCSTSQQAAQYVNQEGASTICEFQLVTPKPNYVTIAPKGGEFKHPDALESHVSSEPKSGGRKRPLTRGGRLSAGQPRTKPKMSSETDTVADTLTIYADGDNTQSSTITFSNESLPFLVTEDIPNSADQNTIDVLGVSPEVQAQNKKSDKFDNLSVPQEVNVAEKITSQQTDLGTSNGASAVAEEGKEGKKVLVLIDTSTTRSTPGSQQVKLPKDKRMSMSTPRRRRSHIRTLDFSTPPKDTSQSARKANTSPKNSSLNPLTPGTAAKFVRSCSRRSFLKSHSESGVRTNKVKAHLFKSPEYILSSSSGYKPVPSTSTNSLNSSADSPKPSTAWDHVSGVGLILESSDTSPAEHHPPKKAFLRSWDSDLRSLIQSTEEKSKSEPVKRKRKMVSTKSNSKGQGSKKTKKNDEAAELSADTDGNAQNDSTVLNVSSSSECDMAKMIEQNLLNASVECEPETQIEVSTADVKKVDASVAEEKASVSPKAHSSPLKSSVVSSPKSDNMLDFEANITAYCIEKDQNVQEPSEEVASDESFASSVQSKSTLKTLAVLRKGDEKLVTAAADSAPSTKRSSEKEAKNQSNSSSKNDGVISSVEVPSAIPEPTDHQSKTQEHEEPMQVSSANNPISSIFDTPVKGDLFSMVPLTPRFLSPNSGTMEDTPRTKIIKSHPHPAIPSSENSVQSPTFPPTPTIPSFCGSPSGPEYFQMSALDNASSGCSNQVVVVDTVHESLESILIKECTRIESSSAPTVLSEEMKVTETTEVIQKNNENSEQMDTDNEELKPPSPKSSKKSISRRQTNRKLKESPGCARACIYTRPKKKKAPNVKKDHKKSMKVSVTSGDDTDISLLSSPKRGSTLNDSTTLLNLLPQDKPAANRPNSSPKAKAKIPDEAKTSVKKSNSSPKAKANKLNLKETSDTKLNSCPKAQVDGLHQPSQNKLILEISEIEQALDTIHGKEEKLRKVPSCSKTKKNATENKSTVCLPSEAASSKQGKEIKRRTKKDKETFQTAPEAVDSLFKAARGCSKRSPVRKGPYKKKNVDSHKKRLLKEIFNESTSTSDSSSEDEIQVKRQDSQQKHGSSEQKSHMKLKESMSSQDPPSAVVSANRNAAISAADSSKHEPSNLNHKLQTNLVKNLSETKSRCLQSLSVDSSLLSENAIATSCITPQISSAPTLSSTQSSDVTAGSTLCDSVPSHCEQMNSIVSAHSHPTQSPPTDSCLLSCGTLSTGNVNVDQTTNVVEAGVSQSVATDSQELEDDAAKPTRHQPPGKEIPEDNCSNELGAPSEQLRVPSEELGRPSEELSTPSEKLSPPSKELSTPSKELSTPSKELSTPSEKLSPPSKELSPPSKELGKPSTNLHTNACSGTEMLDDDEFPHLHYNCDDKEDTASSNFGETYSVERAVAEIHGVDDVNNHTSPSTATEDIRDKVTNCETSPSLSPGKTSDEPLLKLSDEAEPRPSDKAVESLEQQVAEVVSPPSESKVSRLFAKKSPKRTVSSIAADKLLKDVLEQGLGKKVKTPPKRKIQKVAPGSAVPDLQQKSVVNVRSPESNEKVSKPSKLSCTSGRKTAPHLKQRSVNPESSKICNYTSKAKLHDKQEVKVDNQSDILNLPGEEDKLIDNKLEGLYDECYRTVISNSRRSLDISFAYLGLGRRRSVKDVPPLNSLKLQMEDVSITLQGSPFLPLYEYEPQTEHCGKVEDSLRKPLESRPVDREVGKVRGKHSQHSSGSERDERRSGIRDRCRPRSNRSPSPRYRYSHHYSKERTRTSDRQAPRMRSYSSHAKDDSRKYDIRKPYEPRRYESDSKPNKKSHTKSKSRVRDRCDAEDGEIVSSESDLEHRNSHRPRRVERPPRFSSKFKRGQEVEDSERNDFHSSNKINPRLKSGQARSEANQGNQDNLHPRLTSNVKESLPQGANNTSKSRKDSEPIQNKDSKKISPNDVKANKFEEIDYSDSDLENDLTRVSVEGNLGAEDSPSKESDSDVLKTEQLPLRRAPPRSVNALKAPEQTIPKPKRKRKSSTTVEPTSEESSMSSCNQSENVSNGRRQKVLRTRKSSGSPSTSVPSAELLKTSGEKHDKNSADILKKLDVESFLSKIHG